MSGQDLSRQDRKELICILVISLSPGRLTRVESPGSKTERWRGIQDSVTSGEEAESSRQVVFVSPEYQYNDLICLLPGLHPIFDCRIEPRDVTKIGKYVEYI